MLKTGNDICPLPVNLARLIWNAQKLFKCGPAQTIGGGSSSARTSGCVEAVHVPAGKRVLCVLRLAPGWAITPALCCTEQAGLGLCFCTLWGHVLAPAVFLDDDLQAT